MNAQNLGLWNKRFPEALVMGVMLLWFVAGDVAGIWAQEPAQSIQKNDDQDNDDTAKILDEYLWGAGVWGDFIRIFGPLFGDIWGETADDENNDVTIILPSPSLDQQGLTYFSPPGETGESSTGITIIKEPTTSQSTSILDYQSEKDKFFWYITGVMPGWEKFVGSSDSQNSSNAAGNPNQPSSQGTQGSNSGSSDIACPGQKESKVATLGAMDPPAKFRISPRCLCHESFAKVQNAWNHINEKAQGVVAAAKGQTATGESFAPPSPTAIPAVFEEVNQALEGFTTKTLVSDLMQTYSLTAGGVIVVKAKTPGIEDSEKQYCLDGKGIIDLVQAMKPWTKKGQEQLKQARDSWNAEQEDQSK